MDFLYDMLLEWNGRNEDRLHVSERERIGPREHVRLGWEIPKPYVDDDLLEATSCVIRPQAIPNRGALMHDVRSIGFLDDEHEVVPEVCGLGSQQVFLSPIG